MKPTINEAKTFIIKLQDDGLLYHFEAHSMYVLNLVLHAYGWSVSRTAHASIGELVAVQPPPNTLERNPRLATRLPRRRRGDAGGRRWRLRRREVRGY